MDGSRYRTTADYVLAEVVRLRGPLMADPLQAVAHALALAEVYEQARARACSHRSVLAARTLAIHTAFESAKRVASPAQWARARALLTDLQRAGREWAGQGTALDEEITERLLRERPATNIAQWGRRCTLAAALAGLFGADPRLRLICARTLLRKTRPAARRVGRGAVAEKDTDPPQVRAATPTGFADAIPARMPGKGPACPARTPECTQRAPP